MKRAIFLDRDGVLNKAILIDGMPTPPRILECVEIYVGVKDAILRLRERSFEVVVVTNQPDVARGIVTKDSVEAINAYLGTELGIDHFFTCFHDDQDECECRKPKPGLLSKAAKDLGLDLANSYMVGDRWRDIAAGQAAGCRCFFVDHGYPEKSPNLPYLRVSSLIEAAILISESSHDNFS